MAWSGIGIRFSVAEHMIISEALEEYIENTKDAFRLVAAEDCLRHVRSVDPALKQAKK